MTRSRRQDPYLPPGPHRELLDLLKLLRSRSGLGVSQIARKAGYQPSYVSEILHGHKPPSGEAAAAIVGVLGGDERQANRARRYGDDIKEQRAELKAIQSSAPGGLVPADPQGLTAQASPGGGRLVPSAQYMILVIGFDGPTFPEGQQPSSPREALHRLAWSAAADSQLTPSDWQPADLDGKLLLQVPSRVPAAQLAEPFAAALNARLAHRQRELGPARALRLHVALHAGRAFPGGDEPVGPAVELARRLAGAPSLHDTLAAAPEALMAVIASAEVFENILRHTHPLIAAAYAPVPLDSSGETGWLTVPGYTAPPGISPARPHHETSAAHPGASASGPGVRDRADSPPGYVVNNKFCGPVDAGVIGISFGSVPVERS